MKIESLFEVLAPARELSHSRGNFLQHLAGVYQILLAWGASETICKAGLFHSVYGTEFFIHELLDPHDRERLRSLIGPDAESLVYEFCGLERARLLEPCTERAATAANEVFEVSEEHLRMLRCIEMANLIEQRAASDRSPALVIDRLWRLAARGVDLAPNHPIFTLAEFSVEREAAALTSYRDALSRVADDVEQAARLLESTTDANAAVGEPYLLLAAIELDGGRWAASMGFASQGCELLRRWGCPWDKRLSLGDWLGIGARIQELAALGATPTSLWPRLCRILGGST